jgi:hypothetical protein
MQTQQKFVLLNEKSKDRKYDITSYCAHLTKLIEDKYIVCIDRIISMQLTTLIKSNNNKSVCKVSHG